MGNKKLAIHQYKEFDKQTESGGSQKFVISKRKSLLAPVFLLSGSLVAVIVSFMQIYTGVDGEKGWPTVIMLATCSWLFLYISTTYFYFKTLYLFTSAYVLALSIFHLSTTYMVALNLVEPFIWEHGVLSSWIELASWYVLLALGSIGVGVSCGLFSNSRHQLSENYKNDLSLKNNKYLYLQGIGLLIASMLFLVIAIKSYGNIFSYTRQELYGSGPDSRGLRVFMMVFPGAILLLVLSARTFKQKLFGSGIAIFGVLLFMLSGYRSAALFPLLIGVIIWVKTGRKIPMLVALGTVFFVLVSISVIGAFRQMGSYENLGSQQLVESYEKATIADSLSEMGQAVAIAAHVLRLVPKTDPHIYGASYYKAAKEMIPNIGFSVDTDNSRLDLVGKVANKQVFAKMAPSDWLTYRILKEQFRMGGGVGFSAIVEPYLNFGTPAVFIYFSVLGFLLIKLDAIDLLTHRYAYVFSATMLWALIRTVRNDFSNFLKPLGFIIIILLIWNFGLWVMGKKYR